jgi:hypothetical protein
VGLVDQLQGGLMRLRERYGAGPLHLIAVIVSFAIAGYAFLEIADHPGVISFAIFFAGAIIAHDMLAFPIYSTLNRITGEATSVAGFAGPSINYLRVPALLSAFAFVVWFPLILGLSSDRYQANSGHSEPNYLGRWLLLTAGLYLISGIALAIRWRAPGRDHATDPPDPHNQR